VFRDPSFLYDAGIPATREHLRQKLACVYLLAQRVVFSGGMGRNVVMLTPNELVLTFRSCYIYATLGKNRARNAIVRVHTDKHTRTVTDTN